MSKWLWVQQNGWPLCFPYYSLGIICANTSSVMQIQPSSRFSCQKTPKISSSLPLLVARFISGQQKRQSLCLDSSNSDWTNVRHWAEDYTPVVSSSCIQKCWPSWTYAGMVRNTSVDCIIGGEFGSIWLSIRFQDKLMTSMTNTIYSSPVMRLAA